MPLSERQVLDALPVTVYTVDLEGRITMTNRAWSRFASANGAPQLAGETDVCGTSIWSASTDRSMRARVEQAMTLIRSGQQQIVSWEFPCSSPDEDRIFRVRTFLDAYHTGVQLGILPERGSLGGKALLMLRGFGVRSRG